MKVTDCVLRDLASGEGLPQIREMAKELLERRERDKVEVAKPKSLKAPVSDSWLELQHVACGSAIGGSKGAAIYRELLEYRKRTRRTHYQKGDAYQSVERNHISFCRSLVGAPVNPTWPLYIPLDSLKDLHE